MAIIVTRQPAYVDCAGFVVGTGLSIGLAVRSAAWNPSLKTRTA